MSADAIVFHIVQLVIAGSVGLGFWWLQTNIKRSADRQERIMLERQEKQERADKERQELMLLILQSTVTNRTLSKATAIAIKNQRCNGEVDAALKAADKVDSKQAEYLQKVGIRQVL